MYSLVALHHDVDDVTVFPTLHDTEEGAHRAMWDHLKEVCPGDLLRVAFGVVEVEVTRAATVTTFPGVESLPTFYVTRMNKT